VLSPLTIQQPCEKSCDLPQHLRHRCRCRRRRHRRTSLLPPLLPPPPPPLHKLVKPQGDPHLQFNKEKKERKREEKKPD
jgi:hypothetical protein